MGKDLKLIEERSYKVVKANEIIQRARYDLTIKELKAMAFIISKIKPNDTEDTEYTFSIKEFCRVCGIDEKNGYHYITVKKALKKLRDTSFWITEEDGSEVTVGWLAKARMKKNSGKVTVELDADLKKYLLGLYSNYTQYSLLSTLPMSSSYSFRIYELLKSYSYRGSYEVDLDELRNMLSASHYKMYKDFRKRALDVAITEINLYTDIEVSYEPIKSGRKVKGISFSISTRDAWGVASNSSRASNEIDGQLTINELYPSQLEDN